MNDLLPIKLHCMTPQFVVSDLKQSIHFYCERLGFNLTFQFEDWFAGLECNNKFIHLKLGVPLETAKEWKKKNEHVDMTFGVTDIEEIYHATDESIEVIQPLRSMPYGTEFYISDPDGYILAFMDMDPQKSV